MISSTKAWLWRQHAQHRACMYETLTEYWAYHRALDKKKFIKQALSRRFWGWWLLLGVVIAISVALSIFHDRMILAIRPVAEQILHTPGAWAVPVAALVVVSIPPLVGHEIIILVVGVIWGLWYGFLIACAGTFIGEIICYYLFKYTLRERAKKIEEKSRLYAGLAHIMRRDGLWMISLVRFSILPGHITTCIQSTIGISVWIFGIACAISLPKQLAIVYLGVLFGESHKLPAEDSAEGTYSDGSSSDTTHKIVSWTVLCVTGFLTVVAMYVIWFRMWQEEKRIKGENQESGNMSSESKEELILDEGSMRYTLPYMYDPASAESIKRGRAPSYASTSTTAPTIHAQSGRPKMGRSRSSTLGSLAFSNNSLPYLPYTPMLDVHTGNFPIPARNLPSPVPSTVVTFPSATLQEEEDDIQVYGQDSYIEMRTVSPRSDASSSYMQLSSRASTPANSDLSVRARHLRLARSSSNMLLPSSAMHTSTSSTYSPTPSMMNEEIALMPRAASPVGRPRAGSRASSFVNTPTTVSLDSRSSSPGVVSVKDLAEEETILSTTVKAHPLAGSPLESPASPVDDVRQ